MITPTDDVTTHMLDGALTVWWSDSL
jgi:hypothetical protein